MDGNWGWHDNCFLGDFHQTGCGKLFLNLQITCGYPWGWRGSLDPIHNLKGRFFFARNGHFSLVFSLK